MDTDTRQHLTEGLQHLDALMDEMDQALNTPGEGEIRSEGNTKLARILGEFGVEVAKVEDASRRAKDYYDNLKSRSILVLVEAGVAVNKSELTAKTSEVVIEAQEALRKLEHSTDVLQRKSKSGWEYLSQSRSRLSWIGRDRSNV